MSAQEPGARVLDIGEVVGTLPALLGYAPGEDDVAVVAVDGSGRRVFNANVPDRLWEGTDAESVVVPRLSDSLEAGRVRHVFIFGYGHLGRFRAVALKYELAEHVAATAYEVSGGMVEEIDYGVRGQSHEVRTPTEGLDPVGHYVDPAVNRKELADQYGLIAGERVTDEEAQGAQAYAVFMPNNAGARADRAWVMLEDAGPGSSAVIRARIGALVASSITVRDALLAQFLAQSAPRQDNLEYVARTANDAHLAQVSALTAASVYLNGAGMNPGQVQGYASRGQGQNLARLVSDAVSAGMAPSQQFRDQVQAGALTTRNAPVFIPRESLPTPRIIRPSIDGGSGPRPNTHGPSMGPG